MLKRKWLHATMSMMDPHSEDLWDAFRKKNVKATPEEWVRQDALRRLIIDGKYPKESISVEKGIQVNGMLRRYDIAIYTDSKLWMLIECKADKIPLDDKVCDQWMRYNTTLNAPWGALTNGKQWRVFRSNGEEVDAKLPVFGTFEL